MYVCITQHWDPFVQPLLQWKSNENYTIWVRVCSLRYPACNAHVPQCHLWPASLDNIFPHYLIKSRLKKKKPFSEHKRCVLIFSTTFVWNIFHFKRKWTRYDNKMNIGLRVKYPLFLSNFNNLILSTDFGKKTLKYQISWKPVPWKPNCSMRKEGRTDRWTDMTKIIVAFRNFAKAPKIRTWLTSLIRNWTEGWLTKEVADWLSD